MVTEKLEKDKESLLKAEKITEEKLSNVVGSLKNDITLKESSSSSFISETLNDMSNLPTWKKLGLFLSLIILIGVIITPEGEFYDFEQLNNINLDNTEIIEISKDKQIENIEITGDKNYEDEFIVGKGGAQVLFLPCKIDGFWSNFRQVVPSLYLARKFNLTYVQQDLYYKYQDKGRIGGVDGPHNIFDLIDRDYLNKFIHTSSMEEFNGSNNNTKPNKLKYAGIEYGVRCEVKVNSIHLDKYFLKWLKKYSLTKSGFIQNKIHTRQAQWQLLEKISFEKSDSRWVFSGTPKFEGILKDYIFTGVFKEKKDLPEFWLNSFQMIKFAKPIVELQQRAKKILGVGPDEPYIAVHKRVGSTYAIGGKAGQAKPLELVDAINRAKACIGKDVKTIFLSTMLPYLQKEANILQEHFPDHRIIKIGLEELPWETLESGLSFRNKTIRRTGVEMQFWFEADGFVGTRSTMSSVIHLMRIAHRDGDSCNRFSQKNWLTKAQNLPVP